MTNIFFMIYAIAVLASILFIVFIVLDIIRVIKTQIKKSRKTYLILIIIGIAATCLVLWFLLQMMIIGFAITFISIVVVIIPFLSFEMFLSMRKKIYWGLSLPIIFFVFNFILSI